MSAGVSAEEVVSAGCPVGRSVLCCWRGHWSPSCWFGGCYGCFVVFGVPVGSVVAGVAGVACVVVLVVVGAVFGVVGDCGAVAGGLFVGVVVV